MESKPSQQGSDSFHPRWRNDNDSVKDLQQDFPYLFKGNGWKMHLQNIGQNLRLWFFSMFHILFSWVSDRSMSNEYASQADVHKLVDLT